MANGNFAGGDGSKDNPFLIEDAFDLDNVRNGVDKNYKLIKDIDLNITPFNEGEGWIPIVSKNDNRFSGTFDGNGKSISNLFINMINRDRIGLFKGIIQDGIVSNLEVINAKVKGTSYVGIIAGDVIRKGMILNCCVKGGLVEGGYNSGTLVGDVWTGAIVKNCYSTVDISIINNSNGGGFAGEVGSDGSKIINCYSIGKIIGYNNGGLVGKVVDSYEIKNSYWDINTSGQSLSHGGIGKTTEELKTPSTYIEWDKEKLEDGSPVWILKDGEYPKLWFEKLPYKYLLKQNNQYYSIKSQFYDGKMYKPCAKDYKVNGFEDLNVLIKETSTMIIEGSKKTENGINVFEFNINDTINRIEVI